MRIPLLTIVLSCTMVSLAHAHIELLEPTPRYTLAQSGDNKSCPCGLGDSNRLCNVEGDRSDPNRAEATVTTLQAGSTILLRFDEYIGHGGRYRVAIDYDGADLEDFNSNILVDIPDPSGSAGNTGQGSIWEIEVPLPNVSCDKCTLQLIQMMDGNTTDPVPDPVGRSSYYTCADITLVGGDALPETDAGAGSGAADAGAGGGGGGGATGSGCQAGGTGSEAAAALGVLLAMGLGLRRRRALAAR